MSSRADEYRRKAADARERAAATHSIIDKEAWLRMAEEWQRLAEAVHPAHRGSEEPAANLLNFPLAKIV